MKQQEPPYIDKVYKGLKSAYGDKFTLTPEEFGTKMTDDAYVSNAYKGLKSAYGDEFNLTPDEFTSRFKKKRPDATSSNGLETPSEPDGKPISENGAKPTKIDPYKRYATKDEARGLFGISEDDEIDKRGGQWKVYNKKQDKWFTIKEGSRDTSHLDLPQGEPETDRFGISSKLPSDAPAISIPGEAQSKAQSLIHDIKSIENSEEFQVSVKKMEDIAAVADDVNSLAAAIGEQPGWEQTTKWVAWKARIDTYNDRREDYLAMEDEAEDAMKLLRTFDNYVSEYNGIVDKQFKADPKEREYNPKKLAEYTQILKNENPGESEEWYDATAKRDMDHAAGIDSPDAGLERNVVKSFGMAAWSAVVDMLPAGAQAKAAMAQRRAYSKFERQEKILDEHEDDDIVSLSGLTSRGPNKYKVSDARGIIADRKGKAIKLMLESFGAASEQMDEMAERKLIQHIDQVNWQSATSIANFVASSVGQAFGQMPLTFLTLGTSGEMMETGTTYIEGVKKIMEDSPELSYQDIVEQNLDDPAAAEAWGKFAAVLEYTGTAKVFKAAGAKKVFKSMSRNTFGTAFAKGGAAEFATEFTQSVATQYGASRVAKKSVGESWAGIKWRDAFSEGLSGLLGGGVIAGTGAHIRGIVGGERAIAKDLISKEQENIEVENIESIDAGAERIQAQIDKEDKKPPPPTGATPEAKVDIPTESTQQKTDSALAEDTLVGKSDGVIYKSQNGKATITRNDEGKVVVLKSDGTEYTGRQSLEYINESLLNTNPEDYEQTQFPEGLREDEYNDFIIENSSNPIEIAQAYIAEFDKQEVSKEDALAESGVSITEEGWNQEGDRNKTTNLIRNEFFDEEKGRFPSDIAQEINESNPEWESKLTADDVVNYILDFQKDKKGISEKRKSLNSLSDKFQELTGRTLDAKLAKRLTMADEKVSIEEQQKLDEINTALNEASGATVETLQKLENDYDKLLSDERKAKRKAKSEKDAAKSQVQDREDEGKESPTDKIASGVEMLARLSGVTKNITPVEGDSYSAAIKSIGDGLIEQLKATSENVAQKVKEYIKKLGYNISDAEVDKVYPKKKKKSKPPTINEGVKKKKRYESRQLAEFSEENNIVEAIKNNGLAYETVPWIRVNPTANDIINKATVDQEDANKNLEALLDEMDNTPIKAFKKDGELSTLYALIYHKTLAYFKNNGEVELFKKYSSAFSETGRGFGRFVSAMQADSSPEAIGNRITASLLSGREEILTEKTASGQTVAEELSEIQKKLKLSEDEISTLNGIVDELTKKLTGKKSTIFISNADRVKNAQAKRAKATSKINSLLKKSRGQLSSGLPLNILADPEMLKAVRDVVSSWIEEGYYRASEIKKKVLADFAEDKEFRQHLDDVWENIYNEELEQKSVDQQALAFVEALEKRAKTNIKGKKSKKQNAEQILLDTLLAKVNETIRKKKQKPKKTAIDRVREGILNRVFSDEVWAEAMGNVATWLDTQKKLTVEQKAEIIGNLQESVSEFMETPFAVSDLRKAIKTGAKEMNIAIQEVVKKHWTEQNKDMKTLAERLIMNLGLPIEDALAIQSRVESEVKAIFDDTRRSEIYKRLGLDKNGQKKGITDRKAKRAVDKIIEAINLGMLDKEHFQDLFAEKYNLPTLSEEHITQIKRFNDLINIHQGNELSRKYMQDLMNYVEGLKKVDAEKVYNSILTLMIRSMLTGLSTLAVNIPVGSYLAYKANTIPRMLLNPVATFQALRAFKKSGLTGIGRLSFMDIMKHGFNILDEGVEKFDDRKDTRGDYIDYLLNTYDAAKMWKSVRDAKTPLAKSNAMTVLAARSFLKIYQISNYAKAFDVLINHKGEELAYFIEEYNNQVKSSGRNNFLTRYNWAAGMKIADAVKKKMGYDENTVADLKAEVDEETEAMRLRGERVGQGLKQRLLKAKMQDLRDQSMLDRARDFVKTSTLMESPEGVGGMLYEAAIKSMSIKEDTGWWKGGIKTAIKSMVGLFLRISVTSGQRAIENTPVVGLVMPGIFYDLKRVPTSPSKPNGAFTWQMKWQEPRKRNARLAVHAAAMGVLTGAAMAMFDWDDDEDRLVLDPDRWIDITGYGTGQWKDIEQLGRLNTKDKSVRERKNFMISIRINDKWFDILPARLMPQLLPTIAILGSMRDEAELEPEVFKNKKDFERFVKGFDDIGLALTEQSFATIPRFASRLVYGAQREGVRGVGQEVIYAVANPLKSTLYPNMLRDVNNEIQALSGDVKKSGSAGAKIIGRDIPGVEDMMLNASYDIFGYSIKKESKLIMALENNPALNIVLDNVTDFKNINKERYEEEVWQAKMELHPNLIMKGYWARGESYEMKLLGVEAYGRKMRDLWEIDLKEKDSDIKTRGTVDLEEYIHRPSKYGWHNKSIKAAKKAIEKAKEENEVKNN